MAAVRRHSPRLLAPEVVQTSAMDCGPAALKCLLDGFGLPASYGRLREACQTDVDGTSIDTLEDLANAVGLIAEQTSCPSIMCSCPRRRRPARHRCRATARWSPAFRRRVASSRASHAGHRSGDRPPVAARDGVHRRAVPAHDARPCGRVASLGGVGLFTTGFARARAGMRTQPARPRRPSSRGVPG